MFRLFSSALGPRRQKRVTPKKHSEKREGKNKQTAIVDIIVIDDGKVCGVCREKQIPIFRREGSSEQQQELPAGIANKFRPGPQ